MQQQETSGDYGYDLAHDLAHDAVQPSRRPDPAGRREQPGRGRRSGPPDPAGDLEYDEAHDF